MKRIQHRYIQFFGTLVLILALVRCWVPAISPVTATNNDNDSITTSVVNNKISPQDTITSDNSAVRQSAPTTKFPASLLSHRMTTQNKQALLASRSHISSNTTPHPIYSVSSYSEEFPDTNDLQLVAAKQWGVKPVADRADAENRKMELVYVAASPYYSVTKLNNSIPYLVPKAALLLQDIGKAYYDSLVVKGLPIHQFLVTSILRTTDDVTRLRRSNRNATENSCHLYGTTFDIAYNKYKPLTVKGQIVRREVRSDTLKWVLSEVLRDMRKAKRCYIKYEVKQGCFHITTR